jgi:hypothetical protein
MVTLGGSVRPVNAGGPNLAHVSADRIDQRRCAEARTIAGSDAASAPIVFLSSCLQQKRTVGRVTASQIASASAASFWLRLHVRLHIPGQALAGLYTEVRDLRRPEMRGGAGSNADPIVIAPNANECGPRGSI